MNGQVFSRRKVFGGVLATAAMSVVGVGCGRAEIATSGEGITVTDLSGATVSLPHPARRVVTIPKPAASMMVAVNGGPEVLVGMNADSRSAVGDSFLGVAYPELSKVSTEVAGAEFAPNVESVLALEPDVVIQWGDRGPGIVEPLRNAGLRVAQLSYGTQQDLEGALALYGELLGKPERAATLIGWMHERMRLLRNEVPVPDDVASRPSVLYLRGAADRLDVGGRASYNHFVTELVGARNPAVEIDTAEATIDTEQLLRWNPDIILLGNFGPVMPADLYGDPALASLRAVAQRRIYKVPQGGYRWDPPSQESALMWQWLAGVVHGTRAPGLRAEVAKQYLFCYGTEPTDAQMDEILYTTGNSGSRDYVDFGR